MPSFKDVEVIASLSFEVFCGTCGCGLCSESETSSGQNAYVNVNACQNCIDVAREEIRSDLEDQIQELQDRLTRLGEE